QVLNITALAACICVLFLVQVPLASGPFLAKIFNYCMHTPQAGCQASLNCPDSRPKSVSTEKHVLLGPLCWEPGVPLPPEPLSASLQSHTSPLRVHSEST